MPVDPVLLIRLKDVGEGTVTTNALAAMERRYGITLPADCLEMMQAVGPIKLGSITALGPEGPLSVDAAIEWQRFLDPAFPNDLVPLAILGRDKLICWQRGRLVLFDAGAPAVDYSSLETLTSYEHEVVGRLCEASYRADGLAQLHRRVVAFGKATAYDHTKGGKLPRPHDWRPYRFCIQDVVLGSIVLRLERSTNQVQVDVFLQEDAAEFVPDAGAEALLLFLFGDAWKSGSTMHVKFTKKVEGGRIPAVVRRLAARHGVRIRGSTSIDGRATAALWLRLTRLEPSVQARVEALEAASSLRIERVCHAVHGGQWTQAEVGYILTTASSADSVLGGLTRPEDGLPWTQDLLDAAEAILVGLLLRKLSSSGDVERVAGADAEDAGRDIVVTQVPDRGELIVACCEALELPWTTLPAHVEPGQEVRIIVRARDAAAFFHHLAEDVRQASRGAERVVLLAPGDLGQVPENVIAASGAANLPRLVAPVVFSELLDDAVRRLRRCRVTRRA